MTVRVFDFFSGCGGTSYGFRQAGMSISLALDCDPDSAKTFRANLPEANFFLRDIRRTRPDTIRELVVKVAPKPVLFCGCAPCQPFTKQKTTQPAPGDDERLKLLPAFADLVRVCLPDIVFVENVPGLHSFDKHGHPFAGLLTTLEDHGYRVAFQFLRLADYGVPQTRRRLILLASRHGAIQLPPRTHGPGTENPDYLTVADAIGDLPPIGAGEEHPDIANHRAAGLSRINLLRIRATPEGGGQSDWPESLRLDCHRRTKGFSDVYGRLSWTKPASALTTRCVSYSNGRFGHPSQDRAISAREAAYLQTFPLSFRFRGGLTSVAKQIGNAVPVRFATIVGEHVNLHLRSVGVLN